MELWESSTRLFLGMVPILCRVCFLSGGGERIHLYRAKVLLGLLAVIGPVTIAHAYVLMPALIVTLAVCVYGLVKIPDLTSAIISGRLGIWSRGK